MNQLRINPEQVSHVRVYDQTRELNNGWNTSKYKFLPSTYKEYFFGLIISGHKEGYYRNGIYDDSWRAPKLLEGHIDVDGWMEEKPHIEIFAGKELMKRMYFDSLEGGLKWLKENLPNVSLVIIENV